MSDAEIEVRRLRLRPGDIVILKCSDSLSSAMHESIGVDIRSCLNDAGHGTVPVMLLDESMSIEVIGHVVEVEVQVDPSQNGAAVEGAPV